MSERLFIPKRLSEARLAAGMSMSGLAEHCGITAQAVSAYESGLRSPSPSTLFQLATNLMVPMHYMTSSRPSDNGGAGPVFFRSLWNARTKREYDRRSQGAVWAGEMAHWINQYVKLPEVSLPDGTDSVSNDADIEGIADKLRDFWAVGEGPIGNLVRLLETKGIIVVKQRVDQVKVDAFSRIVLGRPIIFLSYNKGSAVRSRFDAAHELAHVILHRHLSQDEINRSGKLSEIERQANLFAGAFLMPKATFGRELYGNTFQSFLNLKHRWKVSLQAMIMRAAHLQLIDDHQKQRLMVQIGARGFRVKEPLDKELLPEEPLLLKKAWDLIIDNGVRTPESICEDLALRTHFISEALGIPPEKLTGIGNRDNILQFSLRHGEDSEHVEDLFPAS